MKQDFCSVIVVTPTPSEGGVTIEENILLVAGKDKTVTGGKYAGKKLGEAAEELFKNRILFYDKTLKNLDKEDFDDIMDDGYYETEDGTFIAISWPERR